MNAAAGLLQMCKRQMLSEPIEFTQDHDGSWHFANEAQPIKTVIDPHGLKFLWIKANGSRGIVEITLDGKTVIYDRIGTDPHGHWICVLRIGKQNADASAD